MPVVWRHGVPAVWVLSVSLSASGWVWMRLGLVPLSRLMKSCVRANEGVRFSPLGREVGGGGGRGGVSHRGRQWREGTP